MEEERKAPNAMHSEEGEEGEPPPWFLDWRRRRSCCCTGCCCCCCVYAISGLVNNARGEDALP
jgi:hypothetical protein